MNLKGILTTIFLFFTGLSFAQDSTQAWYPGDDAAFYRYLEDRLWGMGAMRAEIGKNGETVLFEIHISDSGYVDSVRIQQCFNYQLCYNLRQILYSMPRANAEVRDGKTVDQRRVYSLIIRLFRDGYQIEPTPFNYTAPAAPLKLKWGIALAAIIVMLIFVVK